VELLAIGLDILDPGLRRRRWKRLIVRVELDATEIGVLVSRGYLNSKEKDNLDAIQQAANDFISDAMLL
jgi:hypothetical protein